jgi:hypothetical protein
MKCLVCGFSDNREGDTQCRHCGNPLAAIEAVNKTVIQPIGDQKDPQPGAGKDEQKTRVGSGREERDITRRTVIGRSDGQAEPVLETLPRHCPSCNYLLRIGQDTCPSCSPAASAVSDSPIAVPHITSPVPSGKLTRRMEEFVPAFKGPSVRLEPVNSPDHPVLETRDFPLKVGRQELDPKDDSISSSGHLVLYQEEGTGAWKLRNQASNKALFVQVEGDVPVHSGTVILVGQHRLFRIVIQD